MKKVDQGGIIGKEKLIFNKNKDLEEYYESKWKKGGYKKGYRIHKVNLSKIYHQERHASAIKFLNPKKEEIILEAGCGKGDLALKIAKKCKKIYAIDISKSAFQKVKKKAPNNLVFKKMNLEKLEFKRNSFDKIVCVETLEHVLNPERVIR